MLHINVSKYCEKFELNPDSGKVIVALSGGPDSVALLHIMKRLGFNCLAAHCNFHLRMEESDADELFVRNLCETLKIELYCIDFDTIKYADDHKISIEMAARDLRYNWFEKLAKELDANTIVTGHHADDNVETMLLNLIRGTGIRGLSGIPPRNGMIFRPLLTITRDEILKYLNDNNLNYRTDSTNALNDFSRNKIRNEVLPLLQTINPSVKQTLSKSIARFSDIRLVYEQHTSEKIYLVVDKSDKCLKIDIEKILSYPSPELLLFEILYPLGFHPDVIEQVNSNLISESGKLFYSKEYKLLKDRNYLILNANNENEISIYTISQNETLIVTPFKIKIEHFKRNYEFSIQKKSNYLYVDAQKLKFPLQLRRWQNGDVFFPFGMKGSKKVSDYLIDTKVNIIDKENIWVLISDNDIIWVVGCRADNRFRISEKTSDVIRFEFVEN